MSTSCITWVLESQVFPATHSPLREAITRAGHRIVDWQDDWWAEGNWPGLADSSVVFHGSLENAARIRQTLPWQPGSFCDVAAFHCSSWYQGAQKWLLHCQWQALPAKELVDDSRRVLDAFGNPAAVFVRPDSPLKPFSGRVLASDKLSLEALDYGFYYDDASIPVVVAPVREVAREWRYVVVDRRVVAGSAYVASGRKAIPDEPNGAPWKMATQIAAQLDPPEAAYILDVCEADGEIRLLELNPFSGADLYACRPDDVVAALSELAVEMHRNASR